MDFLVLTKSGGAILGPIANILGYIMDFLFMITSTFNIFNIGLCIILFTLIVKLLMFPLTIKQQKSSKLMSIMNPEIQAAQKKYKGKKDQDSMMKQNAEIQGIYEKYGTSPTGGCLQLLIQMPILFALYRVIYNIPAYVSSVRTIFENVVTQVQAQAGFTEKIAELATVNGMPIDKFDFTNADKLIDLLYKFTPEHWDKLEGIFPAIADIIQVNAIQIERMNSFLGINLAVAPGWTPSLAWLIPILAGLSQWYSTKLMTSNQQMDASAPGAQSMKMMNTMMPVMSAFFCITFPSGIGIYWIASSVFQIIQQIAVNRYMDKININDMIANNVEKMNKKRAKKGLPPAKVSQKANVNVKNIQSQEVVVDSPNLEEREKKIKNSTEYYNRNANAKPGSLAAKAGMVQAYNEKNNKK